MEATVLSVGKSVLDATLSYTRSAVAEEVALQLGIQNDHDFVKDELQMMQSFLMAADEEPDDDNRVSNIWYKQVGNVAYDVEDCLHDFSVHLDRSSCWPLVRKLRERRRIAGRMRELRAKVEDVSKRNMRYQLFKDPTTSRPAATAAEQRSKTEAAIFGINEARHAKTDLVHLISKGSEDLGVIAVWGTSGDLGQTSVIRAAYDHADVKGKFPYRAWVRVADPFNPREFVQSLVDQFASDVGVHVLLDTEKELLATKFRRYVEENRYLIVLNNLSTIEQWDRIKICFPNKMKGSRIIVSTTQVEVANLCPGQEILVSELSQLSADQTLYAFYDKDSQGGTELTEAVTSSNEATTSATENPSEGSDGNNAARNNLTRIYSLEEESRLIGRDREKSDIMDLILNQSGQELQVISVWGMGGLGKTTLVKDTYQSQSLSSMFEKRACVTVMRPFILREFLKDLVMQLDVKRSVIHFGSSTRKSLAMLEVEDLIKELARLLENKRCLIVLDDLSSTAVWDSIIKRFPRINNTSRIIVTTREENVARHCSSKQENVYKLNVLQYKDALDLFTKKVFKETSDLDSHPALIHEAKMILKKCNGLPLAIVTIGGFLANQPKTVLEWRKLNKHICAELEMNPELEVIKTILTKSYDGLPYHLKSCFLYLSIFPEDEKVSRRRLVRRWIAEGYSREIRDKSVEEVADSYLMELIDRSMVLSSQQSVYSRKAIDSCHVHDLMREIGISKSMEENLVYRLEGAGSSSKSQGIVRHLAISSNWKGDKSELENSVDLSRVRSVTVFGMVRPFYFSEKMRMLRVLDLEGTEGLVDHHLRQIGQLYHLKYLSLRGCGDIYYLPESFGNLRQLETLNIALTSVRKLPKAITRLTKLQFLRAGTVGRNEAAAGRELCLFTLYSMACCAAWCAPQLLKRRLEFDGEPNRDDVCTVCCCSVLPILATRDNVRGVQLPNGTRKLKAMQTMGLVNLAHGNKVIRDIRTLTQLRKLAVTGISMKNAAGLCLAIASLSNLESLLLRADGTIGLLGCLLFMPTPPRNLQSLKLYGTLGPELPTWIAGIQSLVKLTLRSTKILDVDTTIEALGKLPNLTILRLRQHSFIGHELSFTFREGLFPSLTVMEFDRPLNLQSVEFNRGTMRKLEHLNFCAWYDETRIGLLSGLPNLAGLKHFTLSGSYDDEFVEDLRAQIASIPNAPVFKRQ